MSLLSTAACINQLYFIAFTSDAELASSKDLPNLQISLTNGTARNFTLYEYHTSYSDKALTESKGDLWNYTMSSTGFHCITFVNISGIALFATGSDGWNIESAATVVSVDGYPKEKCKLLSADIRVYHWLNGRNEEDSRFDLSLVKKLDKSECGKLQLPVL